MRSQIVRLRACVVCATSLHMIGLRDRRSHTVGTLHLPTAIFQVPFAPSLSLEGCRSKTLLALIGDVVAVLELDADGDMT